MNDDERELRVKILAVALEHGLTVEEAADVVRTQEAAEAREVKK